MTEARACPDPKDPAELLGAGWGGEGVVDGDGYAADVPQAGEVGALHEFGGEIHEDGDSEESKLMPEVEEQDSFSRRGFQSYIYDLLHTAQYLNVEANTPSGSGIHGAARTLSRLQCPPKWAARASQRLKVFTLTRSGTVRRGGGHRCMTETRACPDPKDLAPVAPAVQVAPAPVSVFRPEGPQPKSGAWAPQAVRPQRRQVDACGKISYGYQPPG